jgi:predicted nucleic acid-binding protein
LILPDVNVLVNAFRGDAPDHALCRSWLDGVVNGESRYGMSTQVLSTVVRVTTHPKVFKQPSPLDEALRFGEVLLGNPTALWSSRATHTGGSSCACAGRPT